MTITERHVDDVTVLKLSGRLVLGEGELDFRKRMDHLIARGRVKLLVDLREVVYIDSAGVGQLVAKYLSAQRNGGDLKLLHLSARTEHIMSIAKLLDVFETYEGEDEALRSFAAVGRH